MSSYKTQNTIIIMAGEFKVLPFYYQIVVLFWTTTAIFTISWAYYAKGVVPEKYLSETGLALGIQWSMLAALVGFAQVMSVVMYRTLASRPDPLQSAADRFMVVASKALNNWLQ